MTVRRMWIAFLLLLLLGRRAVAWIMMLCLLAIVVAQAKAPNFESGHPRQVEQTSQAVPAGRTYIETPERALPDPLLDPLYNLVPLGR